MINPWKKLAKASLFLEVLDARAPQATTSLTFHKEFKGRSKIIFLMKTALADKNVTRLWIRHYRSLGNYPQVPRSPFALACLLFPTNL